MPEFRMWNVFIEYIGIPSLVDFKVWHCFFHDFDEAYWKYRQIKKSNSTHIQNTNMKNKNRIRRFYLVFGMKTTTFSSISNNRYQSSQLFYLLRRSFVFSFIHVESSANIKWTDICSKRIEMIFMFEYVHLIDIFNVEKFYQQN